MSDNATDDFLAHYGVKGMKWGQRREAKAAEIKQLRKDASDKGYSAKKQNFDKDMLGHRASRRVARRVVAGEKIGSARAKEYARSIAVTTAILAAPAALSATSRGLSSLAGNINAKRGAAEAAKLLADTRGLTPYKTVALAYDAAANKYR